MRVICISTNCLPPGDEPIKVKEGGIYTVIDTHLMKGMNYYEFAHDIGVAYTSKGFIPCSEIDERELIEHRALQSI
jgi:hypothetical protein